MSTISNPVTPGNPIYASEINDIHTDVVDIDSRVYTLEQTGMMQLDTDATLVANSDALVPSQKAVKTYVDLNAGGGGSQVNVDWNAVSGVAQILNKPTLGTASTKAIADFSAPGHKHAVGDLSATGTKSGSTFLAGDNTWKTPAGGGTPTPIDTDATLAANSDALVPSQKAVKTYVDYFDDKVVNADWFSDFDDAVAAAVVHGDGGVIKLSPNTSYQLERPISLTTGLQIIGSTEGGSILQAATGENGVQINIVATSGKCYHTYMRDLTVRGDGSTTPIGIDARGMGMAHFENIRVVGFSDTQVLWGGDQSDGYETGWTNTWYRGRVVANGVSTGMRFQGKQLSGAATPNNIAIRDVELSTEDIETVTAIHLIDGDSNRFDGCDIGYGLKSLPVKIEEPSWNNTFSFNRFERVEQCAYIIGSYNRFIGNTFSSKDAVKYAVEVHYPALHNQFIGNSYFGWPADQKNPPILEVNGPVGQTPHSIIIDPFQESHPNRVYIRGVHGALVLRLAGHDDAYPPFGITTNGRLTWDDTDTGYRAGSFGRTDIPRNIYAFADEMRIKLPKVSSLLNPNSAYRGSFVRLEGAAGVADGLYVCRKKDDDGYEWVNLTP